MPILLLRLSSLITIVRCSYSCTHQVFSIAPCKLYLTLANSIIQCNRPSLSILFRITKTVFTALEFTCYPASLQPMNFVSHPVYAKDHGGRDTGQARSSFTSQSNVNKHSFNTTKLPLTFTKAHEVEPVQVSGNEATNDRSTS